jgi:hypothetical protein
LCKEFIGGKWIGYQLKLPLANPVALCRVVTTTIVDPYLYITACNSEFTVRKELKMALRSVKIFFRVN